MVDCQIKKLIFIFFVYLNTSAPIAANQFKNSSKLINNLDKYSYEDKIFIDENNKRNHKTFKKFLIADNDYSDINSIKNVAEEEASPNSEIIGINELIIESLIQSEKDNTFFAKDNVIVNFKGNFLMADSLKYDKQKKIALAEGNVRLIIKNQIFEAQSIEYDFIQKKGILLNVKGLINSRDIISDFDFTNPTNSFKDLKNIPKIPRNKVLNTPDEVFNWIFMIDKLTIDKDTWFTKKAYFTNDLIYTNQIQIEFNDLNISTDEEKLIFKSRINYLVLENKLSLPFWMRNRTLMKQKKLGISFSNKLTTGFDYVDKDGFFIGRKSDSIEMFDNFSLNIEPQFLFQRAIKGSTNSFVEKHSSLNSQRVKRDAYFSDYFGLVSEIDGKIQGWNFNLDKKLNTFDLSNFPNAFRLRTELNKAINIFNSSFVNRFYGAYRDIVWNGSIGESEIINAYGWQIDQSKSWEMGKREINQNIVFGLGRFKAEALNKNELIDSIKGSIIYGLDQKFPLFEKSVDSELIDISFKYIQKPVQEGIYLNTKLLASYNFYKDGLHQEQIGLGLGPEIKLGEFKRDYLDYTRVSFLPFYKFSSGNSIFKFDQISDKFTMLINFDQHLIGPLLLNTNGKLNLDSDTSNYGEFIDSKIALKWKRRSYDFGIYYQPHSQTGGISLNLYGFE